MRASFLVVVLTACAGTRGALHDEAEHCASFADFDARAREELDALTQSAPGDVLMRETSRLNQARKQCARHVLEAALSRREDEGSEAVQRELVAMSRAFSRETFDALLADTVGDALSTQVAEARAGTPVSARPEPVLSTMCDEPLPCAQFHCVVDKGEPADRAAQACLDALVGKAPLDRAMGVRDVLQSLPQAPGPARTEAMMQLEGLRRQLSAKLEAARARGQTSRVAEQLTPFDVVPSMRAEVEAARTSARELHLDLAKRSTSPAVAWLHRAVATRFGADPVAPPASTAAWKPSRWTCSKDAPTLPPLPRGMSAQLTARCDAPRPPPTEASKDDLRTFDLESEMQGQRVTGKVVVRCADLERVQSLSAFERELLEVDLQRALEQSVTPCARAQETAAEKACAVLDLEDSAQGRVVEAALALHHWPGCFSRWWAGKYGVALPALEAAGDPGARGADGD